MNITKGLASLGKIIVKHSPEILTAVGVIGLLSAGISAVKNTPKAYDILKEAEEDREVELTVIEKVRLCWKQYIFPVAIAILSVFCIIFAQKITSGRTAALLTACKISEQAAERFETETRGTIGDKEVDKIKDKIAKKEIQDHPVNESDVYLTGSGTSLYYESYSGRYFRANRDFIDRARNQFVAMLQDYETVTVNNYIECFGIPVLDDLTTGRLLGWNINYVKRACGGHMPELDFYYEEIETGEVCGYMRLEVDPKVDYDNSYS